MKRSLLSTCAMALSAAHLIAQPELDSLRDVLASAADDSMRYEAHLSLFRAHLRRAPDSALFHAEAMRGLAGGRLPLVRAQAENAVGMPLTIMGRHDRALEHYLSAIDLYEQAGDHSATLIIHSSVANAHAALKRYGKAVEHYRIAADGYARTGQPLWQAGMMQELGKAYRDSGQLDSAEACLSRSIDLLTGVGGAHGSIARFELAQLRAMRGDHQAAIPLYREALASMGPSGDAPVRCGMHIGLGHALLAAGRPVEAAEQLRIATEIARSANLTASLADALRAQADAAHAMNDHALAFNLLQEHLAWRDTLYRAEQQQAVADAQERFESARKDTEIAQQRSEVEQRTLLAGIAGAAALIMAIAGLLLLRAYRLRKALTEALGMKNRELEGAIGEKDLLLRELHHRVKNNLQLVGSLLRMQGRRINDPAARDAVRESQDRVRSMALIHQDLYRADDPHGIAMRPYVQKLIQGLIESHGIREDRIRIDPQVDEMRLDVDTAVPIGLILNELLVNAMKHAFPEGRAGRITVALRQSGKELLLEVRDDGVGHPEKTDHEGFGLQLLKNFATRLNATYDMNGSPGTAVRMTIREFKITV
ncbi:MAG: tetratricopeptide repeat protein [Flavobacteriales bacterium]|nr:tetratricopeptide repeat protein [Flavobacteriales bacterium]